MTAARRTLVATLRARIAGLERDLETAIGERSAFEKLYARLYAQTRLRARLGTLPRELSQPSALRLGHPAQDDSERRPFHIANIKRILQAEIHVRVLDVTVVKYDMQAPIFWLRAVGTHHRQHIRYRRPLRIKSPSRHRPNPPSCLSVFREWHDAHSPCRFSGSSVPPARKERKP